MEPAGSEKLIGHGAEAKVFLGTFCGKPCVSSNRPPVSPSLSSFTPNVGASLGELTHEAGDQREIAQVIPPSRVGRIAVEATPQPGSVRTPRVSVHRGPRVTSGGRKRGVFCAQGRVALQRRVCTISTTRKRGCTWPRSRARCSKRGCWRLRLTRTSRR
jgi:hypothetical protein